MSHNEASHVMRGREPWFRLGEGQCESSEPFLIGIAGGSASGKTSVSEQIIRQLDVPWVVLLSMDSFYKVMSPDEIVLANNNQYNFDHPNAFDYDLLLGTLAKLKRGQDIHVPIYDFRTHSRHVYGANVVIFEGIFALYDPRILALMDMKLFVDSDDDIRLARRLRRDIMERGRDLQGVLKQYHRFVKPMFDEYIRPTMRQADVIIPRGADNTVAIELITKHIARQLDERGFSLRSILSQMAEEMRIKDGYQLPINVFVMTLTPQLKYIHTMLRDRHTDMDDFIFFADRIARLVVEFALGLLPCEPYQVQTPVGELYHGMRRQVPLCGVSIVRAGVTMERSLRRVCADIPVGKLLIQTDPRTLEPKLHYCKLPPDIGSRYVLLMDATVATGAAAIMAIRVLMDHGVSEDRIVLMSIIGSPEGLMVLFHAFPRIKVVVSAVDWAGLSENYWITPGFGNFGDRYFGTE